MTAKNLYSLTQLNRGFHVFPSGRAREFRVGAIPSFHTSRTKRPQPVRCPGYSPTAKAAGVAKGSAKFEASRPRSELRSEPTRGFRAKNLFPDRQILFDKPPPDVLRQVALDQPVPLLAERGSNEGGLRGPIHGEHHLVDAESIGQFVREHHASETSLRNGGVDRVSFPSLEARPKPCIPFPLSDAQGRRTIYF